MVCDFCTFTLMLTHYSPVNSNVLWPDGMTHAQISQACTKMFKMYFCIHLWFWSHKAYLHNIVSMSVLFEKYAAWSPRGWPSLCVFATILTLPTPSLIFIWGTEPWHTQQRPSWAQAVLLFFFFFSSSLSFSSHSACSCFSVVEAAVVCSLTSFR